MREHFFLDNLLAIVRDLANVLENKDKYTRGHCDRVTKYAVTIAQEMGLSQEEIQILELAALLHDIGKIYVPLNILNKNDSLTDAEFDLIKKHPQMGYNILHELGFLQKSSLILLQHHERLDGKGYPNRLPGEKIDILAKILAVADSYDAMTSSRPYRPEPLTYQQAVEQLCLNRNTQFCPCVVDVFLQVLEKDLCKFDNSYIM